MSVATTHPLSKEIFENLANFQGSHCVSIYLPMHKDGKEQNERLSQGFLKQCLREAETKLEKYEMEPPEIKNYLKPAEALLADIELWRNPSDGLAIFLGKDGMNYYRLPLAFEKETYVNNHFFLKPLLPLYESNDDYYLLVLSQDYVKLYGGNKFGLADTYIEDFAPDQLEKAVGFDFKPKMLEFRTGQNVQNKTAFKESNALFHGHGSGKDDVKPELFRFFREIDNTINEKIINKKTPLIVACDKSLFSFYKEANTYLSLLDICVHGDPEFKTVTELHQESQKLIQPYFEKTKEDKILQFNNLNHTPKASFQISEIVPAAVQGKIDALFVRKGADEFGVFDEKEYKLVLDDKKEKDNISLTNLCAVQTFLQGGKVYLMDEEEMPVKGHIMNALFRY